MAAWVAAAERWRQYHLASRVPVYWQSNAVHSPHHATAATFGAHL